ncbi:hypothetical protein LTR56_016715 [Elasticomyces elasticus]|nr:hypothetical protein LTR56_016715 [Elasticomyces elasticus]KAK3663109.1 hypothetical protein LTR22_006018 [Elasticomyces elasticus]KAK4905670.1 hypothetical protein LTR49_025059 [Elasticomyces elasticus]KAK5750627.1 hypothetical protein LTS12_019334 [Elasticomyces elasticus]
MDTRGGHPHKTQSVYRGHLSAMIARKRIQLDRSEFMRQDARKKENLLLTLPPEIRNEIYALAFTKASTFRVAGKMPRRPEEAFTVRLASKSAPPALTRVSRQIREETLPIHYGRHTFEIYIGKLSEGTTLDTLVYLTVLQAHEFLHRIGIEQCRMIKNLVLCTSHDVSDLRTPLSRCTISARCMGATKRMLRLQLRGETERGLCVAGQLKPLRFWKPEDTTHYQLAIVG